MRKLTPAGVFEIYSTYVRNSDDGRTAFFSPSSQRTNVSEVAEFQPLLFLKGIDCAWCMNSKSYPSNELIIGHLFALRSFF